MGEQETISIMRSHGSQAADMAEKGELTKYLQGFHEGALMAYSIMAASCEAFRVADELRAAIRALPVKVPA